MITDVLRKAISEYPGTLYDLSRKTGIQQSCLSRFVAGKRGFHLYTLDALCRVLRLRLVREVEGGE